MTHLTLEDRETIEELLKENKTFTEIGKIVHKHWTSIADEIIKNSVIQFAPMTTPIEAGLLSGFDNTEINGFKEGVMFGPMMGTIPFVGYVFVLEDGADVEAFKTTLSDNANLRWNICTEAEEKIVENVGNTVFFLMCPKSLDA